MPVFHGSTIGLGTVLFTPTADGAVSQFMRTNGSGVLSFADGGGGSVVLPGIANALLYDDGAGGFGGSANATVNASGTMASVSLGTQKVVISGMPSSGIGLAITGPDTPSSDYLRVNSFGGSNGDIFRIDSAGSFYLSGNVTLGNASNYSTTVERQLVVTGRVADDSTIFRVTGTNGQTGDYAHINSFGQNGGDRWRVGPDGEQVINSASGFTGNVLSVTANAAACMYIDYLGDLWLPQSGTIRFGSSKLLSARVGGSAAQDLLIQGYRDVVNDNGISFQTADAYNSLTERMRLSRDGYFTVNERLGVGGATGMTIFVTEGSGLFYARFGDKDGSTRYRYGVGGVAAQGTHDWFGDDGTNVTMSLTDTGEWATTLQDATGTGWTLNMANTQTGDLININRFGLSGGDLLNLSGIGVFTLQANSGITGNIFRVGLFGGSPVLDVSHNKIEINGFVDLSESIRQTNTPDYFPTGTTETIDLDAGNYQFLNLGSTTGDITLSMEEDGLPVVVHLQIEQHGTTSRDITFDSSWGTRFLWFGTEPNWSAMTPGEEIMLTIYSNGTEVRFQASEETT
jgi:hypothetical protein